MKRVILGLAFAAMTACAFALPTEQQVEAETSQGHYAQAQAMMKEVVAAKPGSAKAHYVYAELLAHNGDFSTALSEARLAQQLEPSLAFTEPEKFRSFEQLLVREQSNAKGGGNAARTSDVAPAGTPVFREQTAPERSGVPGWVWVIGILGVGAVLWRGLARSRAAGATYPQGGMPGAAPYGGAPYGGGTPGAPGMPGYGTNAMPYGANSGMNSGMNAGMQPGMNPGMQPMARPGGGMLGTGLAVGGGIAGGMLLDELLHRREGNAGGASGLGGDAFGGGGSLMPGGGTPNFAQPQDAAGNELEQRPIDFGTGNDWDDGSGGVDMGSGGGGDDGWS